MRRPRKRREALRMLGELGVPIFERGALSPWDDGLSSSMYFLPPKPAVASSEPDIWTHSLQIHSNGPGPKTDTLQLAPSMRKLLVR